ncbi:hypothetical protein RHMOL_Rhmol11G0057800 [Rhododendron molle]|uniref:Uncharacterized protein n=1 Tax=Rhododendron molle TaxID=49168 RepID=A0ACC0LNR7_RHOML|nr:hypothetical protein RHMOL_Rhmol11G0057800 [Rhododendron molle]
MALFPNVSCRLPTDKNSRVLLHGFTKLVVYFNPNFFSIKVHHGGNLTVEGGRNSYVGGQVSYSDYEERDKVSFLNLNEIGRKLGINDEVKFYCKVPSSHFDGGFKLMRTDNDVLKMVRQIKDNVVEIFLVISNSIVDDLLDVNVGNWEWDCGTFPESGITIENIDTIEGLSGTLVEVEDDSDSDKNYDEFNDSDYELSDEDDRLYKDNVDDNTEWAGTLLSNTRVPSQTMYYNTVEGEDMVYEDEGDSTDSDDGFRSWDEEDGDNSLNKALVFKAIKGREEPIFGNGMIFRSRHQLAEAIRQHSILNGKEIRFLKNETTRVRAKCKTYEKDDEKIDCPWEISATDKGVANKTLQVKKYNSNHNCGRIWNNRLMNRNWLARIYFDDIRITPTMKPVDIQEKVRHDFQCDVSESQCYRARGKVLRKIQGTIEDQYARLWDYCNEIKRSNPDTSVYIRLKPDHDGIATNVFQRRWDLTGIPCQHATAVLGQSGLQPEDYVSEWYHKHTFETTYQHIMHPLNGPDMWEKSGKDPVLPAEFTKLPGRPKKSRRREPDEPPKNPFKLGMGSLKQAVLGQSGLQPEDYVSEWYHKHTFEATYQHIMHPLNGPDMWEKSGKDPVLPAEFTKQPGRPKKSRRREPDEPPKNPFKLSKKGCQNVMYKMWERRAQHQDMQSPCGCNSSSKHQYKRKRKRKRKRRRRRRRRRWKRKSPCGCHFR